MSDPKSNQPEMENEASNEILTDDVSADTSEHDVSENEAESASPSLFESEVAPSQSTQADSDIDASSEDSATVPETAEDELTEQTLSESDEPSTDEAEVADLDNSESETESAIDDEDPALDVDPAVHDEVALGEQEPDEQPEEKEKGDPYGGHEHEALKRILEAALFASGTTLSVNHLRDIFEKHERPHGRLVKQLMAELIASYENRGVHLVEVASGYRFQTESETAQWISRLWDEKPQRYSRALMETIALVAYRQPITRGEIEDVRGVAVSSNIIRTLLEREWVRVVGHRDVPGRPAMYATTRQFLDYFGLNSLDQMPSLSEIRDMDELNPQMSLEDGSEQSKEDDKTQAEISFSGMIDKIREAQSDGKTGSEFIDEQLDGELAAMDEVNANFEDALAQQKAEHEHPDLDLDEEDELSSAEQGEQDIEQPTETVELEETSVDEPVDPEPEISDEEKWKIIQEKLAQQQALLDDRESDQSREEKDDE
jgi:segregation and condensation protein B